MIPIRWIPFFDDSSVRSGSSSLHSPPPILPVFATMAATWKTGLFEVCAEPGGKNLCLITSFCGCLTMGDINEHAKGPGEKIGGIIGALCGFSPCLMFLDAPKIATTSGFQESGVMALLKTACCVGCCYSIQVARECQIQKK